MRNTRTSTLWIIAFFGGTIFQYWRGSQVDTLVYAIVTSLLLVASQDLIEIPKLKETGLKTAIFILMVCTSIFLIVRIHSGFSAIFYLILVPVLLKNMWRNDSETASASTPAIRKSSWIWFVIGLTTCLAELGNYFAADVTHNDKAYPTITVLVDPLVADSAGKVVFVLLWAAIGVGLFRVSAKHDQFDFQYDLFRTRRRCFFYMGIFEVETTSDRTVWFIASKDDDQPRKQNRRIRHLVVGGMAFLRPTLSKLI